MLTVAQMVAAEDALIAAGSSISELMHRAGTRAAQWVWRVSGGGPVTIVTGPGNNGGDGYVIAESIRQRGGEAQVIAPLAPATDAAREAQARFGGEILDSSAALSGEVFVDCLFGSGLSRRLEPKHEALLHRLAASHRLSIAVDVPSGIEADTGALLADDLPLYSLTLALGAWKRAHFLMPAMQHMGALRLVDIGIAAVDDAASLIAPPSIAPPAMDAHKYTRGLLCVVGGEMPGAGLLAAQAAQRAGAGYVKLLSRNRIASPPADLVAVKAPGDASLGRSAGDERVSALLVGPGLGRSASARERLGQVLSMDKPTVLDADALMLVSPAMLEKRSAAVIATPHGGELAALEKAFGLRGLGAKPERATNLAQAMNALVIAKGADTVVAAPDGRLAFAPPASSWLSTAGTGDVLAGIVASRLATGSDPFDAACEGVWLHGAAARLAGSAFAAGDLVENLPEAINRCV